MPRFICARAQALLVVYAFIPVVVPTIACADDISPPAREWRSYCQSYMKAIDGDANASDLDATYCVGVTKGLLTGMRVGSQIGALSFGSRIAVDKKLDPDEI